MDEITALNTVGASGLDQNLFGQNTGVLGKDDFLKILVTQLQNQDPLDPSSPDEFASQLAQFSSLEQLQNMNDSLQGSIELDLLLNQAINNTMATTLIGRSVKAGGNAVELTEGTQSVNLNFDLASNSKTVKVEIRDSEGTVIRTLEIENQLAGDHKIQWDGKDKNGDAVESGKYTFEVTAEDIEGNAVTANEFIVGRIDSIRYENGGAVLLLGGLRIGLDAVLEIGYGETDGGDSGEADDSGEDDSED